MSMYVCVQLCVCVCVCVCVHMCLSWVYMIVVPCLVIMLQTAEVRQLIASQDTALDALRLKSFLPPTEKTVVLPKYLNKQQVRKLRAHQCAELYPVAVTLAVSQPLHTLNTITYIHTYIHTYIRTYMQYTHVYTQ